MLRNKDSKKEEHMKYIIAIPWLAAAIIMIVIFKFSAQPAEQSNEVSRGVTEKIVNTLPNTKDIPVEKKNEIIKELNESIRKYAHFALYLLLGILIMVAMKFSFPNKSLLYLWIISILICLIYSVSDEVHQLFVPGRGCQIKDVLIDTSGALAGSGIIRLLFKFIK